MDIVARYPQSCDIVFGVGSTEKHGPCAANLGSLYQRSRRRTIVPAGTEPEATSPETDYQPGPAQKSVICCTKTTSPAARDFSLFNKCFLLACHLLTEPRLWLCCV